MFNKNFNKFFCLLLVLLTFTIFFTSCNYLSTPKSDEQQIEERVTEFLTSYNSGDFDKMLSCFDAKTKNQLKSIFNLMGGLIGGFTGINLNLSDLFSLGTTMTKEDFMKLKIYDITIYSSNKAIVTTAMSLQGSENETVYFYLVWENKGWYIYDINSNKL